MNTSGIREDTTQDDAASLAIASIRLGQLLDQAALLAIEAGVPEKGFLDGARKLYQSVGASVHIQTEAILKAADSRSVGEEE